MILRACPLLEKFQAGMLGVILELSGPFVPANKKCPGEMCLPLQSFELENVTLEYSSLSSLLDVCPSLKDLRLVNVMFMEQASTVSPSGTESNSNMLYNQQMFNPKDHVTRLLEHLKQLQMQLNTFHVSVYAARALDPKLFEMLEVCPQATEWTFWTEGMTESLFKNLSLIPNTLTSLELLWDTCAGSRWSSGLHKYLCQSPHLLHLKAPQTLLLVKHLDVNGRLSAPTTYWGARVIAYPGIWRCRRLKTLHINFDWTNHFHGSAPAPARLVFGYLARVCPYLEDLQLCGKRRDQYENKLWLGLDGGLCLLAGMTRLERLHVGTGCNHFHFEAWELSWITPLGLNLDHRRARQARMAGWAGDILKEEREDVKNTQMETTPTEELIGSELVTMKPAEDEAELKEKLKNLGKLIDVKLMLEQIDSGCFVCWPNLQRIILYDDIEVGRRPSAEMKRLFSKD
ncbi:hypothetical protein FBU30_010562 [Linnemannia zychae]|nr:hypothetical protein FBU30_010562 [Linnemannia zychae]